MSGVSVFYSGNAFATAAARRGVPGTYLGTDLVAAEILESSLASGAPAKSVQASVFTG